MKHLNVSLKSIFLAGLFVLLMAGNVRSDTDDIIIDTEWRLFGTSCTTVGWGPTPTGECVESQLCRRYFFGIGGSTFPRQFQLPTWQCQYK